MRRILRHALRPAGVAERVILNGVPGTVAQAVGLGDIVADRHVVLLASPPDAVSFRIAARRGGAGSDDAVGDDDTPEQVARKLEAAQARDPAHIAHYRGLGAARVELPVTGVTAEEEIVQAAGRRRALARAFPPRRTRRLPSLIQSLIDGLSSSDPPRPPWLLRRATSSPGAGVLRGVPPIPSWPSGGHRRKRLRNDTR